jgi:mannose-6-phosphate isomerase
MDRLDNTVRPYAWGSTTAIPELLGTEPTGQPQAELWMGAHPGAPSLLDRGTGPVPLDQVIAADPHAELGDPTVERFGPRLPFLLKILAAGSPLSVQVHPDLAQAQAGYADEEARGIPVDAPHRNYKDANHKPEMICALGTFTGLCGFRPAHEAADLIERLGIDELKPYADTLRARPEADALRDVLAAILTTDRAAFADTVNRAAEAAARLAADDPDGPHAAAYAGYARAAASFPGDPGVIAGMLLNHVTLAPGEALYLGAGVPHAYFDGLGVEIMANSDNVLRCGLTPKHIDVPELLRITHFSSGAPTLIRPHGSGEQVYDAPIDEFRLSRYPLDPGADPQPLGHHTPQILLCTAGHATLTDADGHQLTLRPGQSAYLRAGEQASVHGDGTVFRATVRV